MNISKFREGILQDSNHSHGKTVTSKVRVNSLTSETSGTSSGLSARFFFVREAAYKVNVEKQIKSRMN